jgi:predicted permease
MLLSEVERTRWAQPISFALSMRRVLDGSEAAMLSRLIAFIRGIVLRHRIASEVDDEVAFHLQQEIEAHIARGLSPAAARQAALRAFGGLVQTREAVGDVRTIWLDGLWRDVRHAVRALRATPAFTLAALAVLTLSIGASTAIFSVVDAVILRPLPYHAANRLVSVGEHNFKNASGFDSRLVAPQNFLDWHARHTVFTGLAAIGYASISLKAEAGQDPEILQTQAVTSDFFSVLGTAPLLGRPFTVANEVTGRAMVAVISYGLWQRRFGGSPDVVGRHLPGIRGSFEIVGVMPPSFAFPAGAVRPTEVWIPNVFNDEDRVRRNSFGYRLTVIGRLRDGVSIQQAQAEMDRITAALAAETPRWFTDRVARVEALQDSVTRDVRTWMFMLLAAVGFVLVIACVNIANLMLVRVSARGRDLAIRAALGASRADLARILLVESLILSLAGAAAGVFVAWLGVGMLTSAIPAEVPRVGSITIDVRILAIATATAVISAILFSALPLIQFSQPRAGTGAMQLTRGQTATVAHQRLRAALIVVEVALAVILLVGSGLFLASFARVASVPLGIDPIDVLTVRVRPLVEPGQYQLAQQRNRPLLREIVEDVRALPGVHVAALVSGGVPLRGDLRTIEFGIPGRALPRGQDLDFNEISPDYFRALRVPLLRGRFFTDDDRQGSEPVVIINEAAARRFFPDTDPLNQTVQFLGTRRIVGVVGNIRHDGPETDWRRQGFVPLDQSQAVGATLVVRLSSDGPSILPAIKSAIWSRFPGIPLPDIQTLSQYLDGLIAQRRFTMLLLSVFGLLGIVIACAGIYGVMAYIVAQRTSEIGIRMALGASPIGILWSVLGRALLYLSSGLAIGLIGAWMLSALVAGFLFQVTPHDPWVYATVAATLIATGVAAALLPARRAARVDPLTTLRTE